MKDTTEWKAIQPSGVSQPFGAYSHAISVKPDRLLFIAGQVAVDEKNQLVGHEDFKIQMEQVFQNLGRILEGADASFENVVKFTTYLIRSQDLDMFYETRRKIFTKIYSKGLYPTNTLVVVDQLARKEWLIEIEAIAALS
jgi:enamine deaminase RidA (YjgF/YER057c/UK114 family)